MWDRSILGPLFFILYVNDVFKQVTYCKILTMYADDTVLIEQNILRKFRRNISDITIITPKTPQIFHPMCSISTGFPQIPSNFPKTFESTFKFKLLPRSTCLSNRNHFISCTCKTACYGLLYDVLDSYMRLILFGGFSF